MVSDVPTVVELSISLPLRCDGLSSKFRLGQKRTIDDQEPANNASVSVEQTNIEGKFVQNAQLIVPRLVTSAECLESVLNKSNTLSMSPTLIDAGKD